MNKLCHFLLAIYCVSMFSVQAHSATSTSNFRTAPSSPQLNIIMPRGVQRGSEHQLTFSGARLGDAEEIFFYHPGIEVKNIEAIDANNIKVTINVAADCRIGEHIAQVRCRSGISEFRPFFVGALPAVNEAEPNNVFEQPQKIEMNQTIHGTCTQEDVDHYSVSCKKGDKLNIEIVGMRLGSAFFDPFIAVLDKDRFEIAVSDDSAMTKQDGFISLIVPEDGDYTILVRETAYRGNGGCRYLLHVGNFPRPTVAFPAGGKTGEKINIRFIGDSAGEITQEFVVPEEARFSRGLTVETEQGFSPTPVIFKVSDLGNLIEAEPNNNFDQATPSQVPMALNGIIESENETDWFKFTAKQGTYDIECFSRRINSDLDAVINIYDANKKSLVGNDDGRGMDPYLRWQCPADGEYYLRVRDHLRRGGPGFVYRVEIAPPKQKLYVGIPRVARYSQYRQSIFVPQGGRFATRFQITRENFGGPVAIDNSQLPEGITMTGPPTVGNHPTLPVVFEAAADAPIGGKLVELDGKRTDAEIKGKYVNIADFVLGPPNNARYTAGITTKLPVVIVEKLPFKIDLVEPKVPLVRDGQINIKIVVTRDEGFTKPIRLEFPFRPPGVGTVGSVTIPEGQNEAVYPLNANTNAQIGDWPVYVIGSSDVGGAAWTSTQLATLKIAERFVTMEMSPASTEQGQPTQVVCKLNQITTFEGNGKVELVGLPAEATSEVLEINKESAEVVFNVNTTANTPPGKHKSLFCRLTIVQQNEPIVAVAGRGELQVDKPLPKKPEAAAAPAETKPAAPAAKPLSRLEKLREAARKLREEKNKQDK